MSDVENAETNTDTNKPNLVEVLKTFPNAPDQVTIDTWKAKHKDIFVSGFSETEIYIWRGVTRLEYKQFQIEQQSIAAMLQRSEQERSATTDEKVTKAQIESQISAGIDAQFKMEDTIVTTCLLWPKLTAEELANKAGTIPALMEQILQNSNFVTPQQASMLVIRL